MHVLSKHSFDVSHYFVLFASISMHCQNSLLKYLLMVTVSSSTGFPGGRPLPRASTPGPRQGTVTAAASPVRRPPVLLQSPGAAAVTRAYAKWY